MKTQIELIEFQWYSGRITDTKPRGTLSLSKFIGTHQNPKLDLLETFDEIEKASKLGNKKLKSELKQTKLFYFTPSAIFKGGRKYSNIETFTGIAQLDFDGLEHEEALDLKEWLFENYEEIYCAYLSPSRKGVKAIIRIPIVSNVLEFKEYYKAIEYEFNWIDGFDSAPKNLALPLFISYDTDILYRENAKIWENKASLVTNTESINEQSKPTHNIIPGDETKFKSNAYYRKITLDIFSKKIDSIVDEGHPQVLSACLILGSRVGAGYLSQSEAESYAESCIKGNQYLSKGIYGYVKTMNWCINKSINNPKYYS